MLVGQPVAVEVKPVVVGSPIGNRLSVFAVIGVGAGHLSAMAVGPVGKAIKAIGIKHGVKNNHHVFKLRCNRRIQRRIEVVGNQGRGVTAAGLVTVNAVHHMHHCGLLGQISRIGRVNNLSSGGLNSLQLIDVGFGGYGVTHQWTTAIAGGMRPQRHHAWGGRREGVEVCHNFMVVPVAFTH